MGRLVDTDDLEKGLREFMKRNGVKSFYSTSFDAIDFETLIDDAPTVDAELTVFCNQCKYYETDTGFCNYHGHAMYWTDFCSRGTKMEESNDDE